MTPAKVLERFRAAGAVLAIKGGNLSVNAPKGAVTPDMMAGLKVHKAAVQRLLASNAATSNNKGSQWPTITPEQAARQFEDRGWFLIDSKHLGAVVAVAKGAEAAKTAPAGIPVYTEDEVRLLKGASPDELRRIHAAKVILGCTVVDGGGSPVRYSAPKKEPAKQGYGTDRTDVPRCHGCRSEVQHWTVTRCQHCRNKDREAATKGPRMAQDGP